ncbi:exotoxin beta-grasp domain-containing protein [Staphylococcus coagulans]|uniref:exotoxin beta-grasp domain-containing protein n=1 Tax=Staphylococcus coagulans TaxID=74706 RepID=UPI00397EF017
MKLKQLILSSAVAASVLSYTSTTFAAETSSTPAIEHATQKTQVQQLFERYSQDKINDKENINNNWVLSNHALQENEIRLELEGKFAVNNQVFTPKRTITLDKGTITLKELDHIVRFANVSYSLYEGDQLPTGTIVIHTKDGNRYTLEVDRALQSHRENVSINTEDLKNITFDIKA